MLQIGICDDEIQCVEILQNKIKNYLGAKRIPYELHVFTDGEKMISSDMIYDIVFLDVEMDSISGIKVAQKLHEKDSHIIIFFVTGFVGYLDDAFDVNAFRYLKKPIEDDRLLAGLESAMKRWKSLERSMMLTEGKNGIKIKISDILYIGVEGRKTRLVTTNGETVVDEPFNVVKTKMSCGYFAETHQSYYVNLNYITFYDKEKVILSYKDKKYMVHMSRRKYVDFKRMFLGLAGES